ncbi:MAG: glycosyltransferase, partial [Chlamydiae bacterium]|nr:glycosyltransferase [Chlamydiota bacterium]
MKKHSCWYLLLILPILLTVPAIHRQLRKHVLKPDVTVTGFIKMADGLGRQSIELIDTLHNHFDVHFQKTRDMEWRDVPLHLHKILKDRSRPLGRVVILEDSLFEIKKAPKDLFRKRHNDQIWLAYSMFETSKAPPTFAHLIEEHFDAVLLPDPFLVKAYQAAGIQKPLFVLPLGLDLAPFLQAPLKTRKNTPFVFANFSTWENRKNQLMLVRAFAKAFGNRPDVFLKLNARRSAPEELAKLQEEITRLN